MVAANQRIQADPRPFRFMMLPAELRTQVYRELLVGGWRTIVLSAGNEISTGSQRCKIEGPSAHGKDMTTAVLVTNLAIYGEALPILYQVHTFDFGIDAQNIVPFFNQTSSAARLNIQCIRIEVIRYGSTPHCVPCQTETSTTIARIGIVPSRTSTWPATYESKKQASTSISPSTKIFSASAGSKIWLRCAVSEGSSTATARTSIS